MGEVLNYHDELTAAMFRLSMHPQTIFIGQGVGCAGTTMTDTLAGVPKEQLLEFPVAEDLQMGTAIGMALGGWHPVCIFPRWNFLLCAANQLVNHLDRLPAYSKGGYEPKVIMRTAIPSISPFDPGPQHGDDFTQAFRLMLRTVRVVVLETADQIGFEYEKAADATFSTLLVEKTALYKTTVPSGVVG